MELQFPYESCWELHRTREARISDSFWLRHVKMFKPRGYRHSHSTLHFFMFAAWKHTNGTLNSSCAFLEFGGETRRRKFVSLTGSLPSGNCYPWGVLKPYADSKKAEMLRDIWRVKHPCHQFIDVAHGALEICAKTREFCTISNMESRCCLQVSQQEVVSCPNFSELARKSFALFHQGVCILASWQSSKVCWLSQSAPFAWQISQLPGRLCMQSLCWKARAGGTLEAFALGK